MGFNSPIKVCFIFVLVVYPSGQLSFFPFFKYFSVNISYNHLSEGVNDVRIKYGGQKWKTTIGIICNIT